MMETTSSVRFTLQTPGNPSSSQSKARLGQLTSARTTGSTDDGEQSAIQTPAIVHYTRKGLPVHLTTDNIRRLPIELVYLAYEHLLDYNPPCFLDAPTSLQRYLTLNRCGSNGRRPLLIAGLRDSADTREIIGNTEHYVACRSFRGVVKTTPSQYVHMTTAKPPDITIALADEPVGRTSTQKRIVKSMARSEKRLLELLSTQPASAICAPLVGSAVPVARSEYAAALQAPQPTLSGRSIADMVQGFSINVNSIRGPVDDKAHGSLREDCIAASVESLRPDKFRLALCPEGPHEILRLVRRFGFDLFMDEWTSRLATMGVALNFSFAGVASPGDEPAQIGINLYDPQYATAFAPLGDVPLAERLRTRYGAEALGDEPTRAYLYHLLHTHEMTAHVLLAMHNICVMDLFMAHTRSSIKDGTLEAKADNFNCMYAENLECLHEAEAAWKLVHSQRGKGRLKGIGQERREDVEAALAEAATNRAII